MDELMSFYAKLPLFAWGQARF